jgi:hypothetical protein
MDVFVVCLASILIVSLLFNSYQHDVIKMLKDDAEFWERQSDKRRDLFQSYYSKIKQLKQSGIISNRVARKYEL